MLTVLVHGFWSGPVDWNNVLKALPLGQEVWTPDLYEPGPLGPHHNLNEWTSHFLDELQDRAKGTPVQAVGYSMGGRLLTNALTRNPKVFHRALVLSAYPMPMDKGREERIQWELDWRQRFLEDGWEELEQEWQEQSVFKGSTPAPRRHSAVLREMLGQSLINWSPTQHEFSVNDVKYLPSSVDWAFGASDQKYLSVAKDLAKLPVQGQITLIENAGHRLPYDASQWIATWIEQGK